MNNNIASQILNELKSINSRVGNLESNVSKLDSKVDNIDSRMDNLEFKYNNLESKLDNLEKELQFIKQAVLETNEQLTKIEATQASQQQIINLLSTRSIQHEAEIKHNHSLLQELES